MKTVDVAKYVVVAYTFTTSPLAGLGFLGYVLYANKKIKNLENQIRAGIQEDKENEMLTKDLDNVNIQGNVDNFDTYKDCIIDNYQNRFYRIMKPSGEYLPKIFTRLQDAKREIDIVYPFFSKHKYKYKKNRIYNVRYVK